MMRATLGCLLAGLALMARAQIESIVPATDLTDEVLDTVLVAGEQPRPGLWKVSNGGNVLWILSGSGSIPGNMPELAQEAEARIRESKEVLYRGFPNVGADISILYALTLIPTALKAAKLPDGKTLKDALRARRRQLSGEAARAGLHRGAAVLMTGRGRGSSLSRHRAVAPGGRARAAAGQGHGKPWPVDHAAGAVERPGRGEPARCAHPQAQGRRMRG